MTPTANILSQGRDDVVSLLYATPRKLLEGERASCNGGKL